MRVPEVVVVGVGEEVVGVGEVVVPPEPSTKKPGLAFKLILEELIADDVLVWEKFQSFLVTLPLIITDDGKL
jgi:hypothetical protein